MLSLVYYFIKMFFDKILIFGKIIYIIIILKIQNYFIVNIRLLGTFDKFY